MPDYGWLRLPPVALPPPTAWMRWGRNLALFLLTAASVFWVGGLHEEGGFSASAGIRLVLGLLSILAAHEMGHYVAARLHKVDVTLPFFIPFPLPFFSLVGTLGAFIRIRSPIPNRRALFDIGSRRSARGLRGRLARAPARHPRSDRQAAEPRGTVCSATPLLFSWFASLFHGPVPEGMTSR